MAVGKIEYKKVLKDVDYTPTKLKDLYISALKDDDFENYNEDFATSPDERYTIISPEVAAAVLARRRAKSQEASESDEETNENEETNTGEETTQNETPSFTPIAGGTWMPMVVEGSSATPTTSFSDKSEFVENMTDVYSKALQERGLDPSFAQYLVAQDALESGWGQHQSGKNNFGGIKGEGTSRKSSEWDGSKMVTVTSSFRDFDNLEDYVNYKIDLVGNSRYNVFAYSPEEYFSRVKAGGYATDPNYVDKLTDTLESVQQYA